MRLPGSSIPGIGGCDTGGTCAIVEFGAVTGCDATLGAVVLCVCGFGRLMTLLIVSFALGTIDF